jgi:hypothetical protein
LFEQEAAEEVGAERFGRRLRAPRGDQAMSAPTESLPIAVKNSPRSNHLFVTYLYNIVSSLDGNASFTNPTPSAATLEGAADGLAQANGAARGGGPASVAERNAQRKHAEGLVDQFVSFVRVTVNAEAGDPATACAMILSAGLSVRKRSKAQKPPFTARYGGVSGEVLLVALAVAKAATYTWMYSLDQKSWTCAPQTMKASTTIAGLTRGQVYFFQFRALTRKGLGDGSQIVSLLML